MFWVTRTKLTLAASLIVVMGVPGAALGETAGQKLYQAYYLERAEGDWAAAAKLYGEVAEDRKADDALRAEAKARLVACREEVAAADFARLVPETALAYLEIRRPGDQFLTLLSQLGLVATDGVPADANRPRVAVSPKLIKALIGIGGAAVAITGFDPIQQKPSGVVIFHPGDLEVVRGLIETGLPVGGRPVESIGGFPTYDVEGEAMVTLTSRLVIASPQRAQIEAVLRRLHGEERSSLATNDALKDVLAGRGDSLLFFCVNTQPMMPLLNGMMAAAGTQNRQLAMAQAVLDLNSLRSLSGRAGVGDAGLFLDISLRLDEDHHNLVYNLMRTPPVNWDTLKCIPEGAAGFVVGALNEAPTRHAAGAAPLSEAPPVVTALDFGREVFANMTSLALFVLPPDGEPAPGGPPIPDAAVAITVNDPAKSRALWTQALGIASLAAGAGVPEGSVSDVDGENVYSYRFPEGMTIHLAAVDHDVLIASSRSAMTRSIQAKRSGKSIVDDPAFVEGLKRLDSHTTKALFLHAGRCAQIAKRFAPPGEATEIEPFLDVLSGTVASVVVNHSAGEFTIGALVSGIPQVGHLVTALIEREQHREQAISEVQQALRNHDWDHALTLIDQHLADHPAGGHAHAVANQLNTAAWNLLTKGECDSDKAASALKLSQRSNELTGFSSWAYVDTLALAKFKTGAVDGAVSLEKKAIELADGAGGGELERALARFEAAAKPEKVADDTSTP